MRLRAARWACILSIGLFANPTAAQVPREQAPREQPPVLPQELHSRIRETPTTVVEEDANQIREEFNRILEKYPPGVGRVLKLDPSLMTNPSYLATYPGLAEFLAKNPGVAHNPGFYLERVSVQTTNWQPDSRSNAMRLWQDAMGGLAALVVMIVVTGTFVWLVKTVIDYRRWNRLSKIQTDVHSKLLERFNTNEDLLAYIQTPSGRRFLDSAPIPLEQEPKRMSAPITRILWSAQAGAVLGVAGLGLMYVSNRATEDVAGVIFGFGVLLAAIGVGFALSAVMAYLLSRRLGLFESSTTDHA
jgi:hypothetical protein